MKPNFNRIKSQIQPESAVVDDTIRKANAIENAEKPMPSRKNFALVAGLCVFILCIISIPYIMNINLSEKPSDVTPGGTNAGNEYPPPIEGAQSYNKGVTISEALSQKMQKTAADALLDVRLKVVNLFDVYLQDSVDARYDGKTYDEWWEEYEKYTGRMIELDAQLKEGPNAEIEKQYNECVEKAEELLLYLDQIRRKQKAEFLEKEKQWLNSLGLDAVYKGGYFVFSATPNEIKNIRSGRCDYFIDSAEKSLSQPEEIH